MTFKYLREEGEYVVFSSHTNDEIRFTKNFWIHWLGGRERIEVNG